MGEHSLPVMIGVWIMIIGAVWFWVIPDKTLISISSQLAMIIGGYIMVKKF